jgi:hypothetical protein
MRTLGRTGVKVSPLCLGAMMSCPDTADLYLVILEMPLRYRDDWHGLRDVLPCRRAGSRDTLEACSTLSGHFVEAGGESHDGDHGGVLGGRDCGARVVRPEIPH